MPFIRYTDNVFINCPFDNEYKPLFDAIVFTVFDSGFVPRCALELDDSGEVRIEKIFRIITDCKFGIHDISRTEVDDENELPRFNMPLELGMFLGAKRNGDSEQKKKRCVILDMEQYRYQIFMSDIAGQDIKAHKNEPENVIPIVRNWLNSVSKRKTIPGGTEILRRFRLFKNELPALCAAIPIEVDELTYNDYTNFISVWLTDSNVI